VRGSGKGLRGEEADCLSDGRLKKATVGRIGASMCWEDLSESKKGGKKPVRDSSDLLMETE
jgi:hypothetical protein